MGTESSSGCGQENVGVVIFQPYTPLSRSIHKSMDIMQGRRKVFLDGWAPVFSIIIPLEKKTLAAANINFDDAMYTVCKTTNGVLQVQEF